MPVTASQVLGKSFLEPLFMHNWRLTPEQKNVEWEAEKKADPADSWAVRLMNLECAGTHSTIAAPSWLFRGMGGFDLELPLGEDCWERILMMDPSLAPRVITDENVIGIDLAARPQNSSDVTEMAALSQDKCQRGSVKRNQESGFNPMAKLLPVLRESPEWAWMLPPKPEEERDFSGDRLTMQELTSDLLYYSGQGWLEAIKKWGIPKVGVVLTRFRIAAQRRFRS